MKQSKLDIEESIYNCHSRSGWRCEWQECNNRSEEVAHSIIKGKYGRQAVKNLWLKLYGEELNILGQEMDKIIHHPFNTFSSCTKHNSYFTVNISNEIKMTEILKMIHEDIK